MTKVSPLKVSIHPLVLMQMSEHYSRSKVQQGPEVKNVYGAILGRQNGRQMEAVNSFALKMFIQEPHKTYTFNDEHMKTRANQYLEVFPELAVIGIYCTGESEEMTGNEKYWLVKLALLMTEEEKPMDSTLFLKLDATKAGNNQNIPLEAYEVDVIDLDRNGAVEWELVSEESERIGVNHIAKLSTKDGKDEGSSNDKHAKAQEAALSMLLNRLELIMAYLEQVQNGLIQPDFEVLKEANLLAQRLKTIDRYGGDFEKDFEKEETTIALFSLLPKLTTLLGNITQVSTKVIVSRQDIGLKDDLLLRGAAAGNRWGLPPDRMSFRTKKEPEDDYLDDEELETEMGGPKRKIHAADSQAGTSKARRERKVVTKRSEKGPKTVDLVASSNSQAPTDHEMENSPSGWEPEENGASSSMYVPDAPMPSATQTQSKENVNELQ